MAADGAARAGPRPLVFRVDDSTPGVVQSVLLERGWDKFDNREQDVEGWNLYWRTSSFRMTEHVNVKPWQQLNHHPGTTKLIRKDRLARQLKHMKRTYGSPLYEFIPPTFVMPSDYCQFVAEYFKEKQTLGTKPGYWICKPAELSRGRGIIIFSDIKDLIFDDTYIVQKYICNPLLVGRYKCDLRIYVCVTGFKPLTIYIYQEGLVRFATEKFDLGHLQNSYAHLTNSSINKSGASYEKVKEVVGRGCKWTLSRFFSYLRSWGVDDLLLWQKIRHVVILTVLAIAPSVPVAANCFELFGFDILIDDNLKPWLLEVNYSPALSLDCSADVSVKRKLIHDTIELIYLHGLRNERHGRGYADDGHPGGPLADADRGRHGDACSPLSCEPLFHPTGRTPNKDKPDVKKVVGTRPESQRASPRRDAVPGKDALPSTAEPPSKRKLKDRLAPRKASTPPCLPRLPSPAAWSPAAPRGPAAGGGEAPDAHAGGFVLIFPFNEATFRASRDGLNVKRIIQEFQKLTNKRCSQAAEKKTKIR
ncbi:putative tubulin polyglutamylase TTLL2 [Pteropus medius]|uniref:probable tubulin polyglutamylase TTLL2 n=1 Tax=Pteropus vampyrus TaxID=132908 RepID=UPI00196A210B|nr:probable tubulin polyglutamylase TTLL2 [Pteropus giganteus]